MARSDQPRGIGDAERSQSYPGQPLGLPESGSGSLAGLGRRMVALLVDWFIACGLAGLAVPAGLMTSQQFRYGQTGTTTVLAIWLLLGVAALRLFQFTPGQFALGLRVASIDERQNVGVGRALVRGVLIAFVVPALFTDVDGRGIQDRVTGTAVVRR